MRKIFIYTCAVLILGASAGLGGYILASHRKAAKVASLQSQISSLKTASNVTRSTPQTQKTASSLAEIKSFKVRFPYSNKPAGLGYTDTQTDTVAFDSESLSDYANSLDPKNSCGLQAAPGPLGFLTRTTNLPLTDAGTGIDGLVKQVGNYYYIYTHPKPCSTNSQVIKEQDAQVTDLINDLKTLEAGT